MEALRFSKTARRTFHDVPYDLTISGDTETLGIEVEHSEDGRRWRSQFGARFIEEITQRTGNHKKFDVFVRMVLSALAQESDAVYIDILTARDLEMLRRHANPQGPPTTSTAGQADKRYLILTYRAEFDKVHYPLPLQLDERSEEETLRSLVGRLRAELAEATETIVSLKQRGSDTDHLACSKLEEDIRQLQRRNAELVEELGHQRREAEALRSELRSNQQRGGSSTSSAEPELRRLRDQCQKQQAELKSFRDDARQKVMNQKREADHAAKELRAERQKVDRLQAQVRKMEEERRTLGQKLQNASRAASAERSRPASRSPSAERSRPPSRPVSRPPARTPSQPRSRPVSRASSVASSRDRTPSPHMQDRRGTRTGSDSRPWATQRDGSPGGGGTRRGVRQAMSPNSSPYSQSALPRRTPSPGQRSRDRTPSPAQRGRGASAGPSGPAAVAAAVAGSGAAAASRRSAFSLREQRSAPPSDFPSPSVPSGSRPSKPAAASRYGGVSGARAGSAPRSRDQAVTHTTNLRHSDPATGDEAHRPGSLFGLAADLGLGPGSLAGGHAACSSGAAGGAAASAADGGAETCDIDARLQALQSFLKQTKTITG